MCVPDVAAIFRPTLDCVWVQIIHDLVLKGDCVNGQSILASKVLHRPSQESLREEET